LDFTGLYNAIMQLIFIITGLASIKSLTEMITQLVGQGDALKDGADTAKEVKSMAAKAGGAAIHGAGLAGAGVKAAIGVAGRVGNSAWANKARQLGGDAKSAIGGKWDDYVQNSVGSKGRDHSHWIGRRALNHRDRLARDNKYLDAVDSQNANLLKAQEWDHIAQDARNKNDIQSAKMAEREARNYRKIADKHEQDAIDMYENGVDGKKISRRGKARGLGHDLEWFGKEISSGGKQTFKNATGFEDGIGIKAMLKGDHNKDTAINQFFHGNVTNRDDKGNITGRDEKHSFSTTINNANKFVFNITGMKGTVKEMLDNADVLEKIEDGDTELARQMQRLVAQTGAKSDKKKAMEASAGQAKATADAFAAKNNATMAAILKALDDIKKKP